MFLNSDMLFQSVTFQFNPLVPLRGRIKNRRVPRPQRGKLLFESRRAHIQYLELSITEPNTAICKHNATPSDNLRLAVNQGRDDCSIKKVIPVINKILL